MTTEQYYNEIEWPFHTGLGPINIISNISLMTEVKVCLVYHHIFLLLVGLFAQWFQIIYSR